MLDFLNGFSPNLIYILLFFLLLLCGIGFPMAEELVLLAGGMLVTSSVLDPSLMFLSTFLGVIVGDVLLFWLGRSLATHLTSSEHLTRLFSPKKIIRGRAFFAQHGSTTVFLARFIPGVRAPAFFLAGTMQMRLGRFLTMDTLAALVFVPIICWAGYLFADHVDLLVAWFRSIEHVILTLLVVAGLSWLLRRYQGRRSDHMPVPPARTIDSC
jgi:membrane-associated protein